MVVYYMFSFHYKYPQALKDNNSATIEAEVVVVNRSFSSVHQTIMEKSKELRGRTGHIENEMKKLAAAAAAAAAKEDATVETAEKVEATASKE